MLRRIFLCLLLGYNPAMALSETQTMPPAAPPPTIPLPQNPSDDASDPSQHSYGTFTPGRDTLRSWSLLTTLEQNGCQLPMVLYGVNGVAISRAEAEATRAMFERAVSAWSSTLRGNPYYGCKAGAGVQWSAVPLSAPAVSVYIDAGVERSYAIVGQYEIRLSPRYAGKGDPNSAKVILHEMGHMVGLSDTYTEPGYQQPIGQPAGIMNNLYSVDWLTLDDSLGAISLYEFINGRGQFCDDPYAVGAAYENRNNVAFCVPR